MSEPSQLGLFQKHTLERDNMCYAFLGTIKNKTCCHETHLQNQISSRVLRTSTGVLAGISRRMSSFIFGSATSHAPGAVSFLRYVFLFVKMTFN